LRRAPRVEWAATGMTAYGRPLWLSRVARSRQPSWPRLADGFAADVAIVGGGMTGCATAYVFAAAGIRTCLLEADRVGQGATGASGGGVRPQPAASFDTLVRERGRRDARRLWEMSRHAALDLAALVRRLGIRCDLEPRDWMAIARTAAEEESLKREYKALHEAGLAAVWLGRHRLAEEAAVDADGGLRTPGGATLDPYRACLGLANAASKRGARIFERSPATRVRAGRSGVEVETDCGPVAARIVVIATGSPGTLFKPLQRHFRPLHTYAVATPPLLAAFRRQLGRRDVVLTAAATSPHALLWSRDDRLIFTGADQPRVAERSRARAVVQRTGQLMYELSLLRPAISGIQPDDGWDAPIAATADGLMIAGPHRHFPHHLFVLGAGHNGPAAALLAARILLRLHAGTATPADHLFGFARL
jgi:gamma-glutamylputrescine oxidase